MPFLIIVIAIAVALGILTFDAYIYMLNINDMIAAGHATFWGIFWILLVSGGSGAVAGANKSK